MINNSVNDSTLNGKNIPNGSFIYSAKDHTLHLQNGDAGTMGALQLISNVIDVNQAPSGDIQDKAFYRINNSLQYYSNNKFYQIANLEDLTSLENTVKECVTNDSLASTLEDYLTSSVAEGVYAKKEDIPEEVDLTPYLKSADAEGIYAKIVDIPEEVDLTPYLTINDANSTYAKKEDIPEVNLTPYLKSDDAEGIYAKIDDIPDVSNFLTSGQIDSVYAKKSEALTANDLIPYLKSDDAGRTYATLQGLQNVADVAGNAATTSNGHTAQIKSLQDADREINGKINTLSTRVGVSETDIQELKVAIGYEEPKQDEQGNPIPADNPISSKVATLIGLTDGLNNNKLNATNGISTGLTEQSKLTVGTKDGARIEIQPSSITKYTSTSTQGTSLLFSDDITMRDNGNSSYTFSKGSTSFTINIPADQVVKSGLVEQLKKQDGKVEADGTYLVLTLNTSDNDKVYINVTDLIDIYTVSKEPSPVTLSINNNEISATLANDSIDSAHLKDTLAIPTLTATTITGGGTNDALTINGKTFNKDGNYSGNADTASALTAGKSSTITGDVSGTITNIGTASSSGSLSLANVNDSVSGNNTSATATVGVSVANSVLSITPITVTANKKGLVTTNSTETAVTATLNLVKQDSATDNKEYALLFTDNTTNGDNSVKYNSNIKINPNTKTITADKFAGTASKANALTAGIKVSASGAIAAPEASWSNGVITLNTTGPGRIDSATTAPSTATSKGLAAAVSTTNTTASFNVPYITMNTNGMISNLTDHSVSLTLNQVSQTKDNTTNSGLPILIANSTSDGTAGAKYASGVTINPSANTISASGGFFGPLTGNATSATQFSSPASIQLTGAVTGEVSSSHGWTISTTSTDKLIVANAANAVNKKAVTTGPAYINLIQNNAGTTASTSQVSLKGGSRVTITADANNAITIESKDFTNDITAAANGAKTSAINTAAADAQSKADAAKQSAINTASADATSKANAAKSAAISTASTDATNKANAAAKTVYNQTIPAPTANEAGETIYPLLAREGIQILMGDETISTGTTESYSLIDAYLTHQGYLHANKVYGSVWNDYAEYRQTHHKVRAGQCVYEKGDGSLAISYERMMPGANIVSDTFGFAIGETDECKTPLAVSGRVLAYPYESKETYNPGDAVCSGPNGTISKMTRAEIRDYPERIVGTVSEIPTYEVWGSGNIKVNGRIWIKVR